MQQPNQSPPGCNPYAVNNKGIAHLLLILLLVAGLSVVGMFLFKMVSGGGLNVMGARIAANETSCQLGNYNVTCTGLFRKQACAEYVPNRGTVTGSKCVYVEGTWGSWNHTGCQETKPISCPGGEAQSDCVRVSQNNPNVTDQGWRCVATNDPKPKDYSWNYSNCRRTQILWCENPDETPVDDCRRLRDRNAFDNVNDPGPFYEGGWRCKTYDTSNGGWNYSGCHAAVASLFKPCNGANEERVWDCKSTVGGYTGFRCIPLTKDAGVCGGGNNGPLECPAGYVVSSCSNAMCGAGAVCSGVRCVRSSPTTVSLPFIIAAAPVPASITPTPTGSSCIPDWGLGKDSQQCCYGSSTSTSSGGVKQCYPSSAKICYDRPSCISASRVQCCAGYVSNSCGNGAFKCIPDPSKGGKTYDADGDAIPDARDNDPDGDGSVGPAQTPASLAPANGGHGSGADKKGPTNKDLITVSGTVKDSAGKGVSGVNINVFLGNGEKPFGNVAATTNADGNYSFKFDRKKINFAVRSTTSGYKPAKSSYTECRGIYDSGYEDCWFSGTDMSGVDFVSTAATPPAVKHTSPKAEIKALSPSNIVTKGTNVDISVFASSQTAGIKKVQLYYNPAYRDNMSMCNDSAVNAVAFPGMEGKWKLIGEKTFDGSQKQLTTTITWNTSNISALSSFGTYYNGTNNPYANKYYIAVNVEDVNTGSDARRCSGNPLGPKACGSNYYHESCGTASWGVVTVNPTGTATVTPAVTVYARGSTSSDTPPMMSLLIRDTVVRTWTVTSTSALQTFTYGDSTKDKGIQPKDVKVKFINDNGPRDLYVDGIKLYGTYIPSNASTVYVTGFWTSTTKSCSPGFHKTRWLQCNGYFQYGSPVPAY